MEEEMLTLTRKAGESIHIGDEIEIVVKEIRPGAVRIGVQAPPETFIYRGELYRKIREAIALTPDAVALPADKVPG